jgi:hypothetical protein
VHEDFFSSAEWKQTLVSKVKKIRKAQNESNGLGGVFAKNAFIPAAAYCYATNKVSSYI